MPTYTQLGSGTQYTLDQIKAPGFNPTAQFIESGTGRQVKASDLITPAAPVVPTTLPNNANDPITSIGSAALGSTPSTASTSYTPTPTPTPTNISTIDTGTLNTANTLGPNEQAASDLTSRIEDINNSLAGESAYQTDQNNAAGIPGIQQAQNDLNLSVSNLQKQAQEATITSENRLAPQFAITGEQAQIERQRSFQALGLSALSDALANNLVAAQSKADQAVAAKYGPLEAEQKAKLANLQLILNDPATTLEDKNRANAQAVVQQAKLDDIAQQKTDAATILSTAQTAATNAANFTPTTQYPSIAVALNAISSAKTPLQAIQIQAATGLGTPKTLDTSVVEVGGRKLLVNNQTGSTIKDLGTATSASTNATLDTTDQQLLLSSGLNSTDVSHIQSDVAQYGLTKVLDGITDPNQKAAIIKAYGGTEPSKITRAAISSLYGIPDNGNNTAFFSFLGAGKTNAQKLDAIMSMVAQYQAVGMSDADILKIIKGS